METVAERKLRLAEAKKKEESLLLAISDLQERKAEADDILALSEYLEDLTDMIGDDYEENLKRLYSTRIKVCIGDVEISSYIGQGFFETAEELLDIAYKEIINN